MFSYEYIRECERKAAAWMFESCDTDEPRNISEAVVKNNISSVVFDLLPDFGTYRPEDWTLVDTLDVDDLSDGQASEWLLKYCGDKLGGFARLAGGYVGYFTQDEDIPVNEDAIFPREDKFTEKDPHCPKCGFVLYSSEKYCDECDWDLKEEEKKEKLRNAPFHVGDEVKVWASLLVDVGNLDGGDWFDEVTCTVTGVDIDTEEINIKGVYAGEEWEQEYVPFNANGLLTKSVPPSDEEED